MATLPRDRLLVQSKIDQQRNTIEALRRDGHETTDAERHLRDLIAELAMAQKSGPADVQAA